MLPAKEKMMKTLKCSLSITILLMAAITSTSAQDVLSINPLFMEHDAVLMPELEGEWRFELFEEDTIIIKKIGDNFYHLRYLSGEAPSLFECGIVRIGNDLLLDLLPILSETIENDYYKEHFLSAHSFYRIKLEGDTFHLALLNYRWFYEQVIKKKLPVSWVWSGNSFVLTAPTEQLRQLIVEYGQEKDFFDNDLVLNRMPSQTKADDLHRPPKTPEHEQTIDFPSTQKDCIPSFPAKDGWLGGDGDISLPLGKSKSLWIFSDSYVGARDQTSRQGSRIISNTVAITTCEPGQQSTIRYFWRDQYTDHPRPIFESHTDRYRFWPADAFMCNNNLYVVMYKVGPKPGASPDDIFDFTLIGMTLAKIHDPQARPPDEWMIKLIPWSHVFDPNIWNGNLVKEGKYLYTFYRTENQTTYLLRLPLDKVESPEGHIEYFTKDMTWKIGLRGDDAKTLFRGRPGSTVRYHPDLRQWIMICGPGFLNNKIRIRTAPELTGPWSEEQLIYECPEATPGSAQYEKSNFCYIGREHIQFYNEQSHTLVITYDCNSTFSKAIANMEIYFPRVLLIPLKK